MNYKSNFPPLKFKKVFGLFILVVFFDLVKNCSIINQRVRTKDCFKCKDRRGSLSLQIQNLRIGFFYVESVCKKSKLHLQKVINMVALGRVKNKLFYSVQSLLTLQHPSLQQLLLHSPVLQPSLQQPSAQQVSLQQVSILSDNSFITELLLIVTTINYIIQR